MSTEASTPIDSDEKWDHALENFIRKSSIGLAVGVLPALLLTRSVAARAAAVTFCTGVGSGVAYGEARYLFDHNVTFDRRNLIQVEITTGSKKN